MKVLARVEKCEMGTMGLAAAEFCLTLCCLSVGGFARWARGHPSLGVVDLFPRSIVRVPHVRQLDDCRGSCDRFERAHRVCDDSALQVWLIGRAGLRAERNIYEHGAV